jgi:4-diphosphocytidyl-2-C-methyl-D-erythritol kinase
VDLLRRRCPDRVGGLRIELRKRIPVGGGLGGGSADAAATLRACNAIFGLDLRAEELRALGAHLGMDVPFLIEGGRAMGTERGDRLAPLAMREEAWAVIAAPAGLAISTRWAYEALDRVAPREGPAFGDFVEALQTRPIEEWAPLCYNSFETAVFPAYSQLMEICNRLRELGCAGAFLTGSGAAVVGVTGESGIARAVAEKMKGRSMRVEAAPFLAARPV